MPILDSIPKVDKCCGCVTDLKTAAAIIVVISIVTSPLVSWAIIRHAYVIRVTCVVQTNSSQPDVVDINFNNALSFGFGANAGLGSSCLSRNTTDESGLDKAKSNFVRFVRYSGWIVLLADAAFLFSSVNFLIKMFKSVDKEAALIFILAGLTSVLVSFVYGILYVSACVYVGSGFPIYEFFFVGVDLTMFVTRLYLIVVISSYYQLSPPTTSAFDRLYKFMTYSMLTIYGYVTNATSICFGCNNILTLRWDYSNGYRRRKDFVGLISSASSALLCTPVCEELYNVSSPVNLPVNILRWILFTSEMLLLASAFAFLLGILWCAVRGAGAAGRGGGVRRYGAHWAGGASHSVLNSLEARAAGTIPLLGIYLISSICLAERFINSKGPNVKCVFYV
ncbi:uncharacterized protein LOC126772964 [Nymphalis io]|uniref:uncharacterized protein LOC126772964 n=1 Tax=Inachis io TaxID=171585 RepID=UPI00216AA005|nr:uncharacterized protein LOC126772964 [Nymphalis io]